MLTLGIETSGRAGSIAIVEDGHLLAEKELSATGRRHARTLVPEVGALFKTYSRELEGLDAVAVSIGPGSFTGLRVGVVCAKTLSYAIGVPVVGVDTFRAIAANSCSSADEIWVIDDALRGDIYVGHYQKDSSEWHCINAPHLVAFDKWKTDALTRSISVRPWVSGPALTKETFDTSGLSIESTERLAPRAEWIARLGEQQFKRGEVSDVWTLEPLYIRRSAAEEKADAAD